MRKKVLPPEGGSHTDLDRELQIDLELEAEELRERGLSDRDADYAARRALGNRALIKEDVHNLSRWARVEALSQDLRYALRMFGRAPAFTTISIVTLALGIGACTAIFSIVHAVLLRPLPYQEPERLALVWSELRARNVPDFPFPIPDVKDLRQETKTLEGVAGVFPVGRVTIGRDSEQPEQARVLTGTPNLLPVLGVTIAHGRGFTEADGAPLPPQPPATAGAALAPPQPPQLAILTHEFWMRRFGGDASIVGQTIEFGNGRAEVIGILSPGFQLLMPPRTGIDPSVDIITPARLNFDTAARNTGALRVIARLKPGVTLEQAQADAEGIATTMRERYPVKKNADVHWRVVPMHDDLVSDVRTSILALFGAVVFVLLIACANVANLLAVRSAARHRELVIRAAIGGSRSRLIRQLLTETLLLAGIGAALGLALAWGGMNVLLAMAPAKLPLATSIAINPMVLAFTALTAVITAILCGVVPALRASRPQVTDALRVTQGAASLRAGRALRNAVVVVEVALSFVLLIGAGLMLRSFIAIQRVDPGYDPSHILTFTMQSRQPNQEAFRAFRDRVEERIRAVPGVEAITQATPLPLDGGTQNIPWAGAEEGAANPAAFRQANFHVVRPGYFETLKTRLIDGRTFTVEDDRPDATNVVIDDRIAARAFPGRSAVGQALLVRNLRGLGGPNPPQNVRAQVVGVVQHQRHESVTIEGREGIFFSEQSFGGGFANRWAVRTAGPPEASARAIRAAILEVDPKATIADLQPMMALVDKSTAPMRFSVVLITIFAGVAVILAVVGLYGVLSTVVRQRTAEIGVRMAFGASAASVLKLIVGEGLRLSGAGVVVGLAAAFAITGLLQSMLVEIRPTDPVTFVSITALFLAISAIAAFVPARRASRLAPTIALRDE